MSAAPAQAPIPTAARESGTDREISESLWRPVLELPCHLTVQIPLLNFRVKDFLALRRGSVIASAWGLSRDVPLRINGALVGWGELEQVGEHLAVRLTELA